MFNINEIKIFLYILTNNIKYGESIINFGYIYREIFNDGDYDLNLNLDNKIIFDIGTNMGIFGMWINDKYKNSTIHCFEPIDTLYKIAKHNINYTNNKNNKFIINNIGLYNESKTDIINYYPNANGLSTIKNDMDDKVNKFDVGFIKSIIKNRLSNVEKKEIKLVTMKEYIDFFNIKHIDFCKIDVEGVEKEIIEGFYEYIDIVDIFVIEVENYRLNNTNNILKYLGNFDITIKNGVL